MGALVHDLSATLHSLTEGPQAPAATGATGVQIAIITAASVVLAALVTAVAAAWQQKRESPASSTPDLISELTRRAITAETRVTELEQSKDSLCRHVDELEEMLWRHGIDPGTGELVHQA